MLELNYDAGSLLQVVAHLDTGAVIIDFYSKRWLAIKTKREAIIDDLAEIDSLCVRYKYPSIFGVKYSLS